MSPLYKSYSPQKFNKFPYINQSTKMCTCINGESLDTYPTSKAFHCLEF